MRLYTFLLLLILSLPIGLLGQENEKSAYRESKMSDSAAIKDNTPFPIQNHTRSRGMVPRNEKSYYRVEMFGSAATGDNTPFWMQNHTWGMVPLEAGNYYLRGGVFHNQKLNKNVSYSLGIDLAVSSHKAYNTFWIQQIYGAINWKSLRLSIGSREDYNSLLDPKLSTGDMILSNNSRPSPELKISTPDFVYIPYTRDLLYFKGDVAVGKHFDGGYHEDVASPYGYDYMKNQLSHHKSFYFRIGNIEKLHEFQFTIGLQHHVQWGGDLYRLGHKIELPRSFKNFMWAFFAKEGDEDYLISDQLNAVGSHVGAYSARLDYLFDYSESIGFYWQHFIEDKSGITMDNARDMLAGFQYKSKNKSPFSGLVLEYLYTKHQSGPIHFNENMSEGIKDWEKYGFGMDNYYNNTDYVHGHSYYGRSMGNPLFLSPEYNKDGRLYFKSNRIAAYHIGAEGYITPDLEYTLLGTYAETAGRYDLPYLKVRTGFGAGLDLLYHYPKIQGLDIKCSLGFNTGKFFNNDSFGAGISITKKGSIF